MLELLSSILETSGVKWLTQPVAMLRYKARLRSNGVSGGAVVQRGRKSGVRFVQFENVRWVDFSPCSRCWLPDAACRTCRLRPAHLAREGQIVNIRG